MLAYPAATGSTWRIALQSPPPRSTATEAAAAAQKEHQTRALPHPTS